MGIVQKDRDLGLECAGVISRVDPRGDHDFHVGDHVLCWFPGSLATHVRVDAQWCSKIPDTLSFHEVVSLPTAYATAIHALLEISALVPDETVLIHSAAGAIGLAAIQISQKIGAQV